MESGPTTNHSGILESPRKLPPMEVWKCEEQATSDKRTNPMQDDAAEVSGKQQVNTTISHQLNKSHVAGVLDSVPDSTTSRPSSLCLGGPHAWKTQEQVRTGWARVRTATAARLAESRLSLVRPAYELIPVRVSRGGQGSPFMVWGSLETAVSYSRYRSPTSVADFVSPSPSTVAVPAARDTRKTTPVKPSTSISRGVGRIGDFV
ncbi:hypothetical protein ATEIFO6365_0001066300 [Aspergillus terreus]|uniref:Uncharacterized protein n=1 Tax=Aspergillus terreus TaxID=33178 RepID=A0A5M3YM83_ASPTE|nr:hypothetical protein ATETN484_0001058400 [Aspergillus terreus]GFF12440.1 hypothetical protein ATEIFO6365_0001066300 [Aspergillus terreus]